jgi:hypothetical protein
MRPLRSIEFSRNLDEALLSQFGEYLSALLVDVVLLPIPAPNWKAIPRASDLDVRITKVLGR